MNLHCDWPNVSTLPPKRKVASPNLPDTSANFSERPRIDSVVSLLPTTHSHPSTRPRSPPDQHKSVKMAPKKKTKTGDTLNSRLALVMKSGKVVLGYKSTLKGKST